MNAKRALGYFLREAAADLWKRRTVNLVSIATIGATLYVLGIFLVLMTNVTRAVASWAEENRISVYLVDSCSSSERVALEDRIAKDPLVVGVEYVSKEEAFDRFRKDFPDLSDLATGLDTNPLPASFEITLKGKAADPGVAQSFAKSLESLQGVDGVRYDIVWVQRVRSLLKVIGWGGGVLGGILLAASVITISGVIRLNVLARREEIEILRLVGATRGFIRGPFLVEGAFQGAAASVLSIAMIVTTWMVVTSSARVRSDFLLSALAGGVMPLWMPAVLLGIGLAVGLAGSLLSVRRAFGAAS